MYQHVHRRPADLQIMGDIEFRLATKIDAPDDLGVARLERAEQTPEAGADCGVPIGGRWGDIVPASQDISEDSLHAAVFRARFAIVIRDRVAENPIKPRDG